MHAGIRPDQPLRIAAALSEQDWTALVAAWTLAGAQPPSAGQRSAAILIGKACRIAMGVEPRAAQGVVVGQGRGEHRGRDPALTKKDITSLIKVIKAMIKKAKARYEITLAMVIKRAKVKASERTARKALQKRGIRFRKMRSKPKLTTKDIKARFAFGKKYRKKSKA